MSELVKLGGYVVQGHGTDETVLWEGSAENSITLSESVNNFERILIIGQQRDEQSRCTSTEIDTLSTTDHIFSLRMVFAGSTNLYDFIGCYNIDNTGTTITLASGGYLRWSNQGASSVTIAFVTATNPFYIRKVIGISRKGGV